MARRGGAGGEPRHELGAVALREEADVLLQQGREHAALVFGDDAVADPRQDQRAAVGRHRLDHEDHGGHEGENDDPVEVLVDVGRVDHVADQIGAERGADGGNAQRPNACA